jgi:hypothetical protein
MTSNARRPAIRPRHAATRASSSSGISLSGVPSAASNAASAFAGSTGSRLSECACSSTNNCPSGKCSASRCPARTASAVLPTPGIPSIACTGITAPDPAAATMADVNASNSVARPVNVAMSRGSVFRTPAIGRSPRSKMY